MTTSSKDHAAESVRVSRPLRGRQPYNSAEALEYDTNETIVLPTPLGVIALDSTTFTIAHRAAADLRFLSGSTAMSNNRETLLLSAEAIAKRFDMDSTWFLTRARENRIPHVRLGKYVRFDPEEIREFFDHKADRHANS